MQTQNTFWPDDTDDKFYVAGESDMLSLMDRIGQKWPGINLADVNFETEYIHTDCLGYDQYDSGDYTTFLVISRKA